MQNAENWLKQWQDEAEKKGLELWSGGEREASQKGFASMSQESADELNGRFTAMQGHTYGIFGILNSEFKGTSESLTGLRNISSGIAENTKTLTIQNARILQHLAGIETNTDKLHGIDTNIATLGKDMQAVKNGINDITLKGIHIKR